MSVRKLAKDRSDWVQAILLSVFQGITISRKMSTVCHIFITHRLDTLVKGSEGGKGSLFQKRLQNIIDEKLTRNDHLATSHRESNNFFMDLQKPKIRLIIIQCLVVDKTQQICIFSNMGNDEWIYGTSSKLAIYTPISQAESKRFVETSKQKSKSIRQRQTAD